MAELPRARRFVELSRPLARGAQFIRARQHAGAQEDRMEVDPPLLARGGSAAVWGQTACWLGLLSLSQTLSCQLSRSAEWCDRWLVAGRGRRPRFIKVATQIEPPIEPLHHRGRAAAAVRFDGAPRTKRGLFLAEHRL